MKKMPVKRRWTNALFLASVSVLSLLNVNTEAMADPPGVSPTIFAHPIEPTLEAQQTKIAKGMSPVDVLLAEQAIRDNWANYTLLIDGDGTSMRRSEWANLTFTKDFKWVWYDANGKTTGQVGIGAMQRSPTPGIVQRPWKHLPITLKFDEVTPTTAKTRAVVVMFGVPKAKTKDQLDGVPGLSLPAVPQAGMAVYHDTWRKEHGIWLKSSTIVYSANCGWFPEKADPNESCVDDKVVARPPVAKH